MISPMTPAGTRVVCIKEVTRSIIGEYKVPAVSSPIHLGDTYTVAEIGACDALQPTGFELLLQEFDRQYWFGLHLFELAALPKSITDCLETVDLPLIIDEFNRQDADATARLLMPY